MRGHTSRIVPSRPTMARVQITVTVTDFATRVDQSFLILPDHAVNVILTGYTDTGGLPRVFKVPVRIQARLS